MTLRTLIWGEALAFSRSWRSLLWTVTLPVIMLLLGANRGNATPANAVLVINLCAFALVTGTFALGLMGYAVVLASYRERGVFQLLRCTPAPASQLFVARMLVQLLAVLAEGAVTLLAARLLFGVLPSPAAIALMFTVLLVAGLAALSLGQVVVAFTRQAAATTAVARVLLIALFLLGGATGVTKGWPDWLQTAIHWSPIRLAQDLLTSALTAGRLDAYQLGALLIWIAALGFAGLRWFRWEHE